MNQFSSLPQDLNMLKDKYVLYARKSSESEDRQVASIENQLEVLWKLTQEKDIQILQSFTESKSAKKPGREQFNAMIETIKSRGDVKGIVCWKLNRLSRNPQDSGVIQQLLYDGTITEIVTPTKTYLEADSDFVMAIESSQAQRFIRDLRDDTKRGVNNKLEKGMFPGLAPAGYKNDKELKQGERSISPHPVYFELVRKIFEIALTGNFTVNQLYVKSRQMGIRNSLGRPLSKHQMYRMLRNPFYTGRFVYDGVTYSGVHTPMITDAEFDAIQQKLSVKCNPRKQIHEFALNGLIKCGVHDYYFTGEIHNRKSGKSYTYYKCSRKGKDCTQPMISESELNNQISEYLGKLTTKKVYIDWCIKWLRASELQDREVRNKQHQAIKSEYTGYIKRIDNLTDRWLSPANEDKSLLTDREYKELKQRYLAEKQSLYQRMNTLDKDLSQWTDTIVAVLNFSHDLRNRWDSGTIEDRKYIMSVVGSELYIKDKKLFVTPRSPFRAIEKLGSNKLSEAMLNSGNFRSYLVGGVLNEARTDLTSNTREYQLLRTLLLNNNTDSYKSIYAHK